MTAPLVLDIDGTLTRADGEPGIDPRVFEPLRAWPEPVVVATGKAFPFPVALCQFLGIEERVIAENGGIVYADEALAVNGDREAADAVAEAFREHGHDLGWDGPDLVNRWRETEIAARLTVPEEVLREVAAETGLEVVDTGYAFHVKDASISKGDGLESIATLLDRQPSDFVAIGDSENDVSTFGVAGESYAVANADAAAREAADHVTDGVHAAGTIELLDELR
ncbi:HAD-IIB family hydrolase [Natronoarchaeum sp. GCM10025703]|uniref:HAD-IIB family hydrolase n=1 Tax=unclassified Natronoarchaeum TaxID=2620183 RepID=UPI003607A90C